MRIRRFNESNDTTMALIDVYNKYLTDGLFFIESLTVPLSATIFT